jgi:hypothetical protein
MDELIDPNQTAYVKGGLVTDSLCSILFMKDHWMEEGGGGVLS